MRLDLLDAGLEEGLGGDGARRPLLGKAAICAGGAQTVSRALLEPGEAVVRRGGERAVVLVCHKPREFDGLGKVRQGDGSLVAEAPGTVLGRLRGIRTALQLGQNVGVFAHAGEEGQAEQPAEVKPAEVPVVETKALEVKDAEEKPAEETPEAVTEEAPADEAEDGETVEETEETTEGKAA